MDFEKLFRKKRIIDTLNDASHHNLKKTLTVTDLTSFGIAAIIGAGIFGTIGTATVNGGPAVSLLFVFTAIACLFSALCYAEFASSVPVSGSAYTYAYLSFGELIAWIIGWDLLMEYAIGNVAVAISWSDYFTSFLRNIHIHLPDYLTLDYFSASGAAEKIAELNKVNAEIPKHLSAAHQAWISAPELNGFRIILDLPAMFITIIITGLVYIGISESRHASNILVFLKLMVILLVLIAGFFYIDSANWYPFAPNGIQGVLQGVSGVFFAYIGFDSISTTAEESRNPQRDLPRAMFYSLAICTVLYILITLVLTGMVKYSELGVGDPLAYAFEKKGLNFISGIVAASAIVAMASVLLVFQLGQPRIWMSMSRDGLLPPLFSKIHPKFKTPTFSTILTGLLVGIPAMLVNLTIVTDLCSIGTLFAFVLVCGGILLKKDHSESSFKVPYINSKYIFPVMVLVMVFFTEDYFLNHLKGFIWFASIEEWLEKIPLMVFIIFTAALIPICWKKNLSLIPVLGLETNLYLMTELGWTNWSRFLIWLVVGLIFYFLYGYHKSRLNKGVTTPA